jgi:hypothetical protein
MRLSGVTLKKRGDLQRLLVFDEDNDVIFP